MKSYFLVKDEELYPLLQSLTCLKESFGLKWELSATKLAELVEMKLILRFSQTFTACTGL